MPCAIIALLSPWSHFLGFWPIGSDSIYTLWSLSSSIHLGHHIKGFGSSFLHVYACLYVLFSVLAFLVLGFATLNALSEFVVVWLHTTPMRPCLDVTTWDASPDARLFRAYLSLFPLYVMICLSYLFVPLVGFRCIITLLLTCPCMSLAC